MPPASSASIAGSQAAGAAGAIAPTRARHVTIWFCIALAVITYIDRVCISQAAPAMRSELGLTGDTNGLGLFGVRMGVRVLRGPRGLARRSHGRAARPHANRDLVVVLHGGHGLGVEYDLAHRDPNVVRRGGSRRFSEHDAHLHDVASGPGARARAGDPVAVFPVGRRADAAPRRVHPAVHVLAPRLRAVRRPRRHLGRGILSMVPRRSLRAPVGEQGGARDAAADIRDRRRRRPSPLAAPRIEACHLAPLRAVRVPLRTAGGST